MASIGVKKIRRDISWTLLVVLILTAGLTAWILIPSVAGSLRNGLESYANNISTFLVVENSCRLNGTVAGWLPQIQSLVGVQSVYPITLNYTYILSRFQTIVGGVPTTMTIVEGIQSAVIGGSMGFPSQLLLFSWGVAPKENESSFILNDNRLSSVNVTGINQVKIGSSDWTGSGGVKFNATVAGISALNPLTAQVSLLWNSIFLRQKLGWQLYNATFGGPPNFLIVKVDKIDNVERVAGQVGQILQNNRCFSVAYDQATLLALQSLQTQSLPLYAILQFGSLATTTAIIFLVSYLASSRRKWEAGLLITQGWSWGRYSRFVIYYYSALALASAALSVLLALVLERFFLYQYNLSGSVLKIPTSVDLFFVATTFPIALAVCAGGSLISASRLKSLGLDRILREY